MDEKKEPKIKVVMVTLNEEDSIVKIVKEIKNVLPNAEILIVDSSSDNTHQIAEKMGVTVIRQYPPEGYGLAMGKALLSADADIIVTADCDGTYPIEQMPELIEWVKKGYELVDGTRLITRPKSMPFANWMANRVFAITANILFRSKLKDFHIKDLHSGMRAYSRELIHKLEFDPNGPALPVEILLKSILRGYKVKIIPIAYNERIGKTKLGKLESTYWTFKRMFRLLFSKYR